jgi:MYXO-CTERM domain-containing protein
MMRYRTGTVWAGVAMLAIAGTAMADDGPNTVVVDLSGLTSNALQGDASNVTIDVSGLLGATLHSVKWDVNLTFESPSWAEEVAVSMTDSGAYDVLNAVNGTEGVFFPGVQLSDPIAGGGTFLLGDHVMGTDTLTIELHEWNFDDCVGCADAFYGTGSNLRINYSMDGPAPGALALLGLAGLASSRRRRR